MAGVDHPVFRWQRMIEQKAGFESDPASGIVPVGYVSSLLGLAYGLYLIAHHDEIPAASLRGYDNIGTISSSCL